MTQLACTKMYCLGHTHTYLIIEIFYHVQVNMLNQLFFEFPLVFSIHIIFIRATELPLSNFFFDFWVLWPHVLFNHVIENQLNIFHLSDRENRFHALSFEKSALSGFIWSKRRLSKNKQKSQSTWRYFRKLQSNPLSLAATLLQCRLTIKLWGSNLRCG